jgi:hypothetical protein
MINFDVDFPEQGNARRQLGIFVLMQHFFQQQTENSIAF